MLYHSMIIFQWRTNVTIGGKTCGSNDICNQGTCVAYHQCNTPSLSCVGPYNLCTNSLICAEHISGRRICVSGGITWLVPKIQIVMGDRFVCPSPVRTVVHSRHRSQGRVDTIPAFHLRSGRLVTRRNIGGILHPEKVVKYGRTVFSADRENIVGRIRLAE